MYLRGFQALVPRSARSPLNGLEDGESRRESLFAELTMTMSFSISLFQWGG